MADDQPDLSEAEVERASTLLHIRRIIGGVLGLYGLLLLGAGLFGSEAEKDMFFFWAGTRPLVDELEDDDVSAAEPGAPGRP